MRPRALWAKASRSTRPATSSPRKRPCAACSSTSRTRAKASLRSRVDNLSLTLNRAIHPASASLGPVCRLDDRPPARDLALDQRGKLRLSPLRLVGNIATKIEKPLAHGVTIERSIERLGELVEDRLRGAFWNKQTVPRRHL